MSLLDRLKEKKRKMQRQMQRGIEATEKMRADKKRKKMDNIIHMEPGMRKEWKTAMSLRKNPIRFMKDLYSWKTYERQKNKEEKKT